MKSFTRGALCLCVRRSRWRRRVGTRRSRCSESARNRDRAEPPDSQAPFGVWNSVVVFGKFRWVYWGVQRIERLLLSRGCFAPLQETTAGPRLGARARDRVQTRGIWIFVVLYDEASRGSLEFFPVPDLVTISRVRPKRATSLISGIRERALDLFPKGPFTTSLATGATNRRSRRNSKRAPTSASDRGPDRANASRERRVCTASKSRKIFLFSSLTDLGKRLGICISGPV